MENYNFWQDFFDTYQSSPDIIKALWILIVPGFVLGLVAILRNKRPNTPKGDAPVIVMRTRTGNYIRVPHMLSDEQQSPLMFKDINPKKSEPPSDTK